MADEGRIRIDKWLWQARFFKTRGLAAEVVTEERFSVSWRFGSPLVPS